jgi:hypothetical protein
LYIILLILVILPVTNVFAERRDPVTNRPLLLVHYMPWYQTPDVSGYWGWHWTMNHFDPSQTDANGHPQLASHFTPLTGPYDSTDEALLEYQVLLMKLSGIDGVIVDWYGMEDFRDYAVLNESTTRLFDIVKRAGLQFVICYEDQSIKHMVDDGHISADEAIAHGQDVMRYMDDQWFNDDAYVKVDGQPLLFVFGPQYFRSSTQWEDLFSVLDTPPALVTLDQHMVSGQLSSYPWPPMLGVNINQDFLVDYLADFYRKAGRWNYVVGGAFPGFYDIYEEAGVRDSYGFLDAQQGETFRLTLQTALDQQPDMIQLITWNDYGEGTIIEPTEEFGYQYLEILQATRRTFGDFSYTAADLQLPLRLYQVRKAHTADETQLAEAFNSILAGDLETAETIIASFE